jgi:hypothetical protein
MRTTLSLEDDVAALLARAQRLKKAPFKQVVNDALRRGLEAMTVPERRKPSRTPEVDLGGCRFGSLDDVAEVLSIAEGESLR